MMATQVIVPVAEASQVGDARRTMKKVAENANLDETAAGNAAIIATELATNLVRHGSGGELLFRAYNADGAFGVEAISSDRGPGMTDVARCLEDGYSTGGTSGGGLGAVRRLASEFDVYSEESKGTTVFARIGERAKDGGRKSRFRWGAVSRPAPNEQFCGDTWRMAQTETTFSLMMVDGLGHGPLAAEAAQEAAHAFEAAPFASHAQFFDRANSLMSGTRGGAAALAHLDLKSRRLEFAGVGNISGYLRSRGAFDGVDPARRGLVSHNGIVGGKIHKVQVFDYELPASGLLILHSDGLQTRWNLNAYPGLSSQHPATIAAVLGRDFIRGRDDASVVVVSFDCV